MSMDVPSQSRTNVGNMMVVLLKLTMYVMSNGNDAIVGNINLCRHLKFNTSSAKPSKIMQQMDNRADIISINWNGIEWRNV